MISLASPDIRESDIQAAVRVLRSGMLVQGPEVGHLEERFCERTGAAYAIAASNGTSTMQLALAALGVSPGDEVIIPSLSYIATANVVELAGARPVFVDIQARTFNIDPGLIESAITSRTKAILPVHEFGLCCDILEIMNIATKHGLPVIEDAACALGASDGGRHAGTFGQFGSFSMHPRKAITSGEGGMLVTDDPALAARAKILRNHGIATNNGKMEFVAAGFNFRLTDFQAALVSSQMERLDAALAKKALLAEIYLSEIKNPNLTLPVVPAGKRHSWQTFHLLLDEDMDQSAVLAHLRENGIGANYGAQCLPAQKFFQLKYQHDCVREFPHGLRAWSHGLAVPLYEKLEPETIRYIVKYLNRL